MRQLARVCVAAILAAVSLAIVTASAPATPADVAALPISGTIIATLDRATPISSFRGRLAWSRYDAASSSYRLVTRSGGVTADVPIAPRSVPFDVDLGPDAHGRTVAVYSRCTHEIAGGGAFGPALYQRGRGCDIYRFDFVSGIERRLVSVSSPVASEAWPTIWGRTVAFVRAYDADRYRPLLYARDLSSTQPSRRLPIGPRAARGADRTLSRAYGLDLRARGLGFVWTFAGPGEGLEIQVRLDTLGGRHEVLADEPNPGDLSAQLIGWPSLGSADVQWAATCIGEGSCVGRNGLRQWTEGHGIRKLSVPGHFIAHTRDAATTYLVIDAMPGADCMGDPPVIGGTCQLIATTPAFG